MKIARIYLRVSTDERDLTLQTEIEQSTRTAGYYVAGVYREKASGARADRPEPLRMIADLQSGTAPGRGPAACEQNQGHGSKAGSAGGSRSLRLCSRY